MARPIGARRRRWLGMWLACIAWIACAGVSFAQTAPKPLAQTLTGDAKAAYEAGKLLFGDGDYAGAEIKFKAAFDASGDARLLWNMAACEKSQRHYARTDQLVREYMEKGTALLTDQERADAKGLLDLIDSFTVKVTVTVNQEGAEVVVDDVSIGKTPLPRPVVVDIGTRKIVVRKDGFKEWTQQLSVGGAATATVDVKLITAEHEGSLHITTEPGSEIFIDGARVGAGHFDGKVKSGGHTLRISAEGMKPYQTEVVVNDDESRTIETPPLERAAVPPPPPKPKIWTPHAETAFSLAAGDKFFAGGAGVFDMRIEYGWKPGAPTELAMTFDFGTINPGGNNCGSSYHGPMPTSATDLDVRYGFQSCVYEKPGFLFGLHFTPRSPFDVYLSIEVGARVTFASYKAFDPLTQKTTTATDLLPGIDAGGRLGIDYHPFLHQAPAEKKPSAASRWGIGVFVSVLVTGIGTESPDTGGGGNGSTPPTNNNDNLRNASYAWLLFGARTSLTF